MRFALPAVNRNFAGLAAALVVGMFSFAGARVYLNEQAQRAEQRLAADNQKSPILVVKQAVGAGEVLSQEMIALRNFPTKYLPSQALTPTDLEQVIGQRLVHAMQPGDPVLSSSLEHLDTQPFSTQLLPGRRAITFPVDEVNSFSGLLAPGDVIDLLYSSESGSKSAGSLSVRPMLQHVLVLATGTTTRKRRLRDNSGVEREIDVQFATITLHVTPDDAQRIILAEQTGTLTAVLRNPDDQGLVPDVALSSHSLQQANGTSPRSSAEHARTIHVIVGNAGGSPRYIRMPIAQGDRARGPSIVARNSEEG